jgi:hypothetical protein
MFGYKPTFSPSNVKSIAIRSNAIFKRKAMKVITTQGSVSNYYMYYKLTDSSPQKLYACACKGTNSSTQSLHWTDVFGEQGHRTTKIDEIMGHDDLAVQITKFVKISSPSIASWTIIEV